MSAMDASRGLLQRSRKIKIEAFEMRCFKKIGNIVWSDKVTKDSVFNKSKPKTTLLDELKQRKLRYFGYIITKLS